jgi:hypothetical protein
MKGVNSMSVILEKEEEEGAPVLQFLFDRYLYVGLGHYLYSMAAPALELECASMA